MALEHLITVDPNKRGGKPCVRGLRITVYDVLEYLASGMSEEQIRSDFPELTAEDIRACLEFAANRERKLVKVPVRDCPPRSNRYLGVSCLWPSSSKNL